MAFVSVICLMFVCVLSRYLSPVVEICLMFVCVLSRYLSPVVDCTMNFIKNKNFHQMSITIVSQMYKEKVEKRSWLIIT